MNKIVRSILVVLLLISQLLASCAPKPHHFEITLLDKTVIECTTVDITAQYISCETPDGIELIPASKFVSIKVVND